MATMNPLEQKARSSFIKGFIIALLLGILVSGGLGYKIYFMNKKEEEREARLVTVYALKADVKSGESMITSTFLLLIDILPVFSIMGYHSKKAREEKDG